MNNETIDTIKQILKDAGIDGRKAASIAKKIVSEVEINTDGVDKSAIPRNKESYIFKTKGNRGKNKNKGVVSAEELV